MRTMPLRIAAIGACSLMMLGGCATPGPASRVDPFEPWNRSMYDVHEVLDGKIVRPAIKAYIDYVPSPVRQILTNFFGNIDDLFSAITGLAAGRTERAGHDLGRVIVNTMAGIGGLIDVASSADIPKGGFDYGLMFGAWGIPQGPYLFVPLFGPTTVRDGTGSIARAFTGPISYVPDVPTRNIMYGLAVVDARAQGEELYEMVDKAAIDRYTFIRRSYLQRRNYVLYDGKVPPDKEDEE
jgi:phospholipid-binding lipoprotein MlaA